MAFESFDELLSHYFKCFKISKFRNVLMESILIGDVKIKIKNNNTTKEFHE